MAEDFEQSKSKVEAALSRIDVTIHPERYDHAWRDGHMGRISGMDRDAWPLPAHVRNHLDRGQSTAWW